MRLKERVLRLNEQLTGNRLLRGMACARAASGSIGTARQLEAIRPLCRRTCGPSSSRWSSLIRDSSSTRDRLETTGILKPETARDLGVVGIAGRASGFDHDLRRDFPHAAYDRVSFTVPVYQRGRCAAPDAGAH